jgi:hypothetical protein
MALLVAFQQVGHPFGLTYGEPVAGLPDGFDYLTPAQIAHPYPGLHGLLPPQGGADMLFLNAWEPAGRVSVLVYDADTADAGWASAVAYFGGRQVDGPIGPMLTGHGCLVDDWLLCQPSGENNCHALFTWRSGEIVIQVRLLVPSLPLDPAVTEYITQLTTISQDG